MKLSPEVSSIIAHGSSLSDRLERKYVRGEASKNTDRLWARWEQVLSGQDLRRRLAWSKLDERDVREALGKPELVAFDSERLPEWAKVVVQLCDAKFVDDTSTDAGNKVESEIPFIELYAPMLSVARCRLASMLPCQEDRLQRTVSKRLCPTAFRSLEQSLLYSLSEAASHALLAEFNLTRPKGCELFGLLSTSDDRRGQHTYYDRFIASFAASGFTAFFAKYPVVARLWGTAIAHWAEHVTEFLQRLSDDAEELRSAFYCRRPLGRVVRLDAAVSDPHHRGRSVLLLEFENGVKLVYKPRSTAADVAYRSLCKWLNDRGAPLPFDGIQSIDRGTHGWAEFVEQADCVDATRFFENAGALLALHRFLGTTDCHQENLIAKGDRWYLVDLETLLHHESRWSADQHDESSLRSKLEFLNETVLGTGMLPQGQVPGQSGSRDISALGSLSTVSGERQSLRWCGLRSDLLQLRRVAEPMPASRNAPLVDGVVLSADEHVDSIRNGFRKTYRFLQEHAQELTSHDGPLETLRPLPIRFVFRYTNTYSLLAKRSQRPEFLTNGAARSIELDGLARAYLCHDEKPAYWPLLEMELHAMENLDVPHFSARADSQDIETHAGERIGPFFTKSAFQRMQQSFGKLGDADLQLQCELISASLGSLRSAMPDTGTQDPSPQPSAETETPFLKHAVAIVEQLKEDGLVELSSFTGPPEQTATLV